MKFSWLHQILSELINQKNIWDEQRKKKEEEKKDKKNYII
jgi:hypothetical protein